MNIRIQKLLARLYRNEAEATGDEGGTGPAENGGDVVGTGNEARLKFLSDINDANEAALADELADVNDDGTTTPFRASKETPPNDETPPQVGETSPVADEVTPPVTYKIKVNGKEIELSAEELIARAQKVESADQYLADAARQRREAEAAAAPVVPAGPTAEELQRAKDAEDREIIRGIQMGSEEEALAALRRLEARNAARPSLNMDAVSGAIDERLAFNEAIRNFRTNFSDIAGDPLLNQLAQQRDTALLAAGDTRSYDERYEEIGKSLRAWKESLVPAATKEKPPVADLSDKQAKKDAAPKPPTGATKKVAPPKAEEDDGEEDPSDVIRQIAKKRGGPQWMNA
jgi:hypothetical protein